MNIEPKKASTEKCRLLYISSAECGTARVPPFAQDGTVEALCTGRGRLQQCKAPPDSSLEVQDMISGRCELCANNARLGAIFAGMTSAVSSGPV